MLKSEQATWIYGIRQQETISQNNLDPKKESIRFIELFAGIGGFRYALASLGAKCVMASEIDKEG